MTTDLYVQRKLLCCANVHLILMEYMLEILMKTFDIILLYDYLSEMI